MNTKIMDNKVKMALKLLSSEVKSPAKESEGNHRTNSRYRKGSQGIVSPINPGPLHNYPQTKRAVGYSPTENIFSNHLK